MTGAALILDVTRAITRAGMAAPTGVDRVDAAYRRWGLAQDGRPVFALARFRRRAWLLDRQGLSALHAHLSELSRPGDDRPRLLGKSRALKAAEDLVARSSKDRTAPGLAGRMTATHAPRGRYLNTSHSAMGEAELTPLAASGIRVGALLHDALPLDRPEFARPDTPALFESRLRAAFSYSDALMANSRSTEARLRHWAGHWGLTAPDILVAPLGIDAPPEQTPEQTTGPQRDPAIFIALGTIEPRKNHLLLLHLWRRLHDRLGPERCPHLHVVGRRGWENENVLDLLERSPTAGVTVHERGALGEAELGALLARSAALLAPSFDEGYGLPVAEALAAGVPVVASDIPAHREVGGEAAEYLDPLDGPGWERAILALSEPDSERAAEARRRAGVFAPPTWDAHFRAVETFLTEHDVPRAEVGAA